MSVTLCIYYRLSSRLNDFTSNVISFCKLQPAVGVTVLAIFYKVITFYDVTGILSARSSVRLSHSRIGSVVYGTR